MALGEHMANETQELRAQAARLFARAIQARDEGNFDFAEVLTAAAQRSIESATDIEAALVTVPQAGQQLAAQQQQQIQPDKK